MAVLCLTALVLQLAGCAVPADTDPFRVEGDKQVRYLTQRAYPPGPIFTDDDVVANSMRGQYLWLEQATQPAGWPFRDVYYRDQIQWGGQLENSPGMYDFSVFDRGLAEAAQHRGRFGFRVMAYCPGCGGNLAPSWLPRQSSGYPDWNAEEFLRAWENLLRELGRRYNGDPRLGFVDLGGYGSAGEWLYQPEYGAPIAPENARRMMVAVFNAFPSKPVMVPWMEHYPELAASISPRFGIRDDCVGMTDPPQQYRSANSAVQNAWLTAPIIGEWCQSATASTAAGVEMIKEFHMSMISSANTPKPFQDLSPDEKQSFQEASLVAGYRLSIEKISLGRNLRSGTETEIETVWNNSGSAPTYDNWKTFLILSSRGKSPSAEFELPIDLRTHVSGIKKESSVVHLPAGLSGQYDVFISISDRGQYLEPMRLANDGRDTRGRYKLGSVTIAASS